MAQKLDKRLQAEGHELKEVIEYAKKYGDWQACRKYNCGYMAMRRFLTEETGEENYGKAPEFTRLNPTAGRTVVEEFFDRLENHIKTRIIKLETKIEQQNNYIELLELERENYRGRQSEDIEAGLIKVMEACEV